MIMKHAGGRPTKYDPVLCEELDKYLETTGTVKKSLPTIQGFSLWLDVNDETLTEWSKLYPEFSATLQRLKKLQAQQLINDGIYAQTNASIVKLMLMNNHGMKERTDATTNDKDMSPVLVKFIDDEKNSNQHPE